MQRTSSVKTFFSLDEMQLKKKTFENVLICCYFGPPFTPVSPWFGMSCDRDSGTCDLRLDSSRLFYLCKFNLIVNTKFQKGALCMEYKAKFMDVKQERYVKPEVTHFWIYVTTLSMLIL